MKVEESKKHTKGESFLCKKKREAPPEKVGCLSRALMSRSYDAAVIRQDMKNRFSPEKIAKQYCCLYGELSKRMELG